MYKLCCSAFLLICIYLFSPAALSAQESGMNNEDTVSLSKELSALKNDSLLLELRSLLDSMGQRKSFLSVTFSLSNRLFSAKNNAFNSQQTSTGVTAFSPSVFYMHKSGLGMGATGYIRNIDGSATLYQTALSPSYDYIGAKAMYGISYTYYAKKKNLQTAVTPFDHEVYAYLQSRKTWLRPALVMGWARGNYQDRTERTDPRFPGRIFYDTSAVRLTDLSLTASLSHTFSFSGTVAKEDMLLFIPQLSLIGGVQRYNITTKTSTQLVRGRDARLDRFRGLYKVSNSSSSNLSLQTAAFSTSLSWNLQAFSITSGYFLGYYFGAASQSRFSHIFNLSLGFLF